MQMTHILARLVLIARLARLIAGVVAFACSANLSFDEYAAFSGTALTSHILIWNFKDILQPEVCRCCANLARSVFALHLFLANNAERRKRGALSFVF